MSTQLLEPDIGVITPWAPIESIGIKLTAHGFLMNSTVGAVYPSSNLAIYVPFVLRRQITAAQLFWYNGATVSGNVDIGIYTAGGARLVSSGSTAQANASVLQVVDITDTTIGPGLFRLALAMNNTTGTLISVATGLLGFLSAMGVTQQATAFALPANSTIATATFDYLPVFGLTTGSVI
jgi:hypothetical protein